MKHPMGCYKLVMILMTLIVLIVNYIVLQMGQRLKDVSHVEMVWFSMGSNVMMEILLMEIHVLLSVKIKCVEMV